MNIESLRSATPGCKEKIHFNNAGASLMPLSVLNAMQEHLGLEAKVGGYEAADLVADEVSKFYSSAARLLNCHPRNIAFTSSATSSFARALSCVPFQPGDSILLANEDYVSNQLAFLSLQKRLGIKIIRAKSIAQGGVDLEDMKKLMDTHRPRLVSLTHVPTNSGLVQPAAAVGQLCRERNILYLLDACQSVGQLPVDVSQMGCTFLSATLRKFLRGPRGAGFLYVADDVLAKNLEPLYIDMCGADWTSTDAYRPRPDAKRFEEWELPYALVLGSRAAIDQALDLGLENIRQRNDHLCKLLRAGISENKKLKLLDVGKDLSSIITVQVPNWKPHDFLLALRSKNINTSISQHDFARIDFDVKGVDWALRISPHYFNTEEEIATLVKELSHLTAS